jgi:hypothetical protein
MEKREVLFFCFVPDTTQKKLMIATLLDHKNKKNLAELRTFTGRATIKCQNGPVVLLA